MAPFCLFDGCAEVYLPSCGAELGVSSTGLIADQVAECLGAISIFLTLQLCETSTPMLTHPFHLETPQIMTPLKLHGQSCTHVLNTSTPQHHQLPLPVVLNSCRIPPNAGTHKSAAPNCAPQVSHPAPRCGLAQSRSPHRDPRRRYDYNQSANVHSPSKCTIKQR
jgi:hypothetical protein